MEFFQRILVLIKIVIPSWKTREFRDLSLLSIFLVVRTFLSIYVASINGHIVKAIINKNFFDFLKNVRI